MADQSLFPPFAVPVGTADPEAELIFPEGFQGYDPQADNELVVRNPEPAEKAGYFDRHMTNVRVPVMYSYPAPAEGNTGAAVLICPGGGYGLLAADKEGHDFARLFNSIGISAFVLYYPMPLMNGIRGEFPYLPLRSAQRALRLIRSRAPELHIDPEKVGIMGFSAGAHLAATVSTLWRDQEEQRAELQDFSCRPSFSILIYPVISAVALQRHTGSILNLLGDAPSQEMLNHFSPELQADGETPPAFLVQAEDDAVPVENSILYFQALKNAGVPVEMHIYPQGGHGYGMIPRGMPVDTWPDRLRDWILRLVR